MAVIKSGASTDQWTIDPVSKAGRVTIYDSAGNEFAPASEASLTDGSAKMHIWDGSNVLGTLTHPVVTSSAPPQDVIASGTIASSPTDNVEIGTQGAGTVKIYISGSWSGTLQFEASPDGTAWNPATCFPKPSNLAASSSTTANGIWAFASAGAFAFRVRASAWSTGVANIFLEATQASGLVQVYNLYSNNLLTSATCVGTLDDDVSNADTIKNLGVLSGHSTAFDYPHTQDTVGFLHMDLLGNLRTRNRSESVLGDLIMIPRLNQIEINFSEGFDPGTITNTSSGGGSFVVSNGTSVYATGSAITARATGVTVQQLTYHPGHEWYCKFTAGFTTPTDGFNPNHQRIGPFNTTDGLFIGFEKDIFCFSQFQNSIVTSIPKSAFNGDPVDGSVNSAFTRRGVPEALNFNNINIYRIRGSWFGTAPVQLQVFSPDMEWISLHTFNFPNTVLLPYTFTTNWNIQIDVFKSGSDSTDLKIKSPCIAMGTNNDTASLNESLSDYSQAKLVRAVLTGKNRVTNEYDNVGLSTENAVTVSGSGKATLDVAVWDSTTAQDTFVLPLDNDYHHNTATISFVTTSTISAGAITFEASIDNIHFLGITGVDVSTGLSMPSAIVAIVAGSTKIYTFNTSGFNYFRYRLSTAIVGSATVTSSYLLQGLSSPSVSTTITTGTINVSSNQGNPNTLNNAWPTELTDGTNGPVAVKAPSTPAGAADKALVVAISPNNSVAVTGTFFPATQPVSGTLAVTQSTSPWVTSDNHFTHNLNQDGSGNVGVNVQNFPVSQTVSGGVTAQILDVGGVNKASVNASGQLAIVEAALDAALIAQEATTSGVKGLTIFGAVTTAAPSYTTGKSDALSLDTSGLLRVSLKDTPANTNKFLVTADAITFASAQPVVGNLTHNNAAPAATNVGVLPALANAVNPTFTEGDQTLLSVDLIGGLRVSSRPAAPATAKWSHAIITVSAATGTQTLITAVGGQTIRVMKVQFTTNKATNINFLDSTPTNLSGTYILNGSGSSYADSGDGEPLWIGAVGKSFQINISAAAVTLGGDIWYTQS